MKRYQYIDADLTNQVRWLKLTVLGMIITLSLALLGWMQATRTQRLSFPPLLEYGGIVRANEVQPWEVYNFAGFVWQALNRCEQNCETELPERQQDLSALLSTEFATELTQDRDVRRAELAGRERYLLPIPTTWTADLVEHVAPSRWHVRLDMIVVERIGTTEVKRIPIRYRIEVVAQKIDPVYNPWGLYLHKHASPPLRLLSPAS